MNKTTAAILIILVIVIGIIATWVLFYTFSYSPPPTNNQTCIQDSDCVPTQCCHPTSCSNQASISRVCTQLCTNICLGPLDCGAGSCGCVNGKCSVVPS